MPLHFPTSSFFETAGSQTSGFMDKVRDSTADFSCQLWAAYPKFITQGKNLGASFARGYMTDMCQSRVALPSAPSPPFSGGQCEGVYYDVTVDYTITEANGNQSPSQRIFGNVRGKVQEVIVTTTWVGYPGVRVILCVGTNADGSRQEKYQIINFAGHTYSDFQISVDRVDGLADVCGDPDGEYDSPEPTPSDLTTVINVDLSDGSTVNYNLTYNQLSPTFNFPMGFKLNGINVTLDVSGITIYGGDTYISPTSGNDVLPPGGDGGDDGVGGGDTNVYINQDYPVLPDLEKPVPDSVDLETLVCEDGVLSATTAALKVASGMGGWASLVSTALNALLTEMCEAESECVVGFPEYYELKPGAERAAIVYLYKTLDGGKWGSSTYSTTVHHPTPGAIAEIDSLLPPARQLGQHVARLTLLDGSAVRVSGDSVGNALTSLNWATSRVLPSLIPADSTQKTVVSFYPLLQETEVRLRAVEYYPDGAGTNKAPEIRRYIDADEYS